MVEVRRIFLNVDGPRCLDLVWPAGRYKAVMHLLLDVVSEREEVVSSGKGDGQKEKDWRWWKERNVSSWFGACKGRKDKGVEEGEKEHYFIAVWNKEMLKGHVIYRLRYVSCHCGFPCHLITRWRWHVIEMTREHAHSIMKSPLRKDELETS